MSRYDVFDENDEPSGRTATYEEVHGTGLWHRGVHVVVASEDGQVVMQTRAKNLAYRPGEIEVSVGGGVDAGEAPIDAGIREVYEELGLRLTPAELYFVGKKKFNHRTKTQINRQYLYAYVAIIDSNRLALRMNAEESTELFFMSVSQLRRAIARHRFWHAGVRTPTYAYWQYLLEALNERRGKRSHHHHD